MTPVTPRKRFGQHFLEDGSMLDRIVSAFAPAADDLVLEIGPGTGALTERLLETLDRLTVVELDRDLAALLRQQYDPTRLEVIQGDILSFDIVDGMSLMEGQKVRIIGNLPYNISTPLLFHLLDSVDHIQDMVFMLQREVALRMVAEPGDSNYGRLSVMVGVVADCRMLFDVPPECFNPPPKVDSSVVHIMPGKDRYSIASMDGLGSLVKTAFSQRRKTLRNSLRSMVSPEQFEQAGIDSSLRAQNLSVEEFVRLSNTLVNK